MLTIEVHVDGGWREAASVDFLEMERGVAGATRFTYDDMYFFDHAAIDALEGNVIDRRSVSVRCPVDLQCLSWKTWPAWLLDALPQCVARIRIAHNLNLRPDDPAMELPLLVQAGGSPIGNFRIRQSWEKEQCRIAGINCPPLTDQDIAERSERFMDVLVRFAHLASGSSGVQGEWPKALMTRSVRDGCWYPDPFVPTDEGMEHAIVKLLRSTNHEDGLIIASEAPYLETARAFGLNVAAPLRYSNGVLFIPRFDRTVKNGKVLLHGQESLVSSLGVAAFGHFGYHEDYIAVIRNVSDDPAADILEYVLRDVLNFAMGNPDNHGRNSALQKPATGGIRLSPLYDFAPMRISAAAVGRSTRWKCMAGQGVNPDWGLIAEAAASDDLPADRIKEAMRARIPFLQDLPRIAADAGVNAEVIARAINTDTATALDRIR